MDLMDKIDAALDSVLRASGSMLKHYTMAQSIDRMREAMRKIIAESYLQGCNDTRHALSEYHTTGNHQGLGMDNDANKN